MTLNRNDAGNSLKISGPIHIDGAHSLREALLGIGKEDLSEVDLNEVVSCDAAALQVLLAAEKDALAAERQLRMIASKAIVETAADLGFSLGVSGWETGVSI